MSKVMKRSSQERRNTARRGMGRRDFLGLSLAGAAVAAGVSFSGRAVSAGKQSATNTYLEQLETPIIARHQVVVAGGGPSGLIAALAAARSGAETLLIERHGVLGGTGTADLVSWYSGFRGSNSPHAPHTVKGIPAEYIDEIARLEGMANWGFSSRPRKDFIQGGLPYQVRFDPEAAKVAALNLVKREGVKLRLHSLVVSPMTDGSRVTGVVVESKSGRQAIAADVVVDATGDGDVAARAGASFMLTGKGMPMCLMYRLARMASQGQESSHRVQTVGRLARSGPSFAGNALDTDTLTRAEVETRLQLWNNVQAMRKKPGNESVFLLQTATSIGVRETRRIIGEYVVTERDADRGARFPDVVAVSERLDIPYRSLVPNKVEGLVLTGRCISCERRPFQSSHFGAPTLAIGHGSGCAAALAAIHSVLPRKVNVRTLQELLLSQEAELRM